MLPTGTTLGPYQILALIGKGGMGEVYRVRDTRLGRDVALKVIGSDQMHGDTRRFEQEARAAGALNHPNVCAIFDIGTHEGSPFVVMELLEGMSLRARLNQGPIPSRKAIDWAAQAAHGLAAAHEKGIIHRDLKPENLFLTKDGRVKVLDFGLAKLTRPNTDMPNDGPTVSMTAPGTVLGTAGYMAPEQVRGEPSDQRTDIFALGTILYELLAGRRAFPGSTFVETSYRILSEDPPPPNAPGRDLPAGIEVIVRRCLEKTPRERFQEASDLAFALESLQGDRTGSTVSRGQGRRLAGFGRGRWFAVLGVAAAIVLTGITLVLRPGRDASPPTTPMHEISMIAVLPFQNLSGEGPNAYFAGGLHDELLTQLSKVAAITVISRTSVMGYQETTKPLRQIADELGVGSVVEGSVQVVGGRLRVNVQLIDATSDKHRWAESYDRTLDDAFAVQSEVAQRIVAAVGAVLTSDEHGRLAAAPTQSAEAYRYFLQGREYFVRPALLRSDLENAQKLYERALGLDPRFALAHAELSRIHGFMYWLDYDRTPVRAMRLSEEAEAALRLAPELPQAHFAMGAAFYIGRRDYRKALGEYAIALKGLPADVELCQYIGFAHRRLGEWNEALAAFERAAQLDPRNARVFWDLGGATYDFLHRYPEAVRAYEHALSLAPDMYSAAVHRAWAYVRMGQVDTLRAVVDRLPAHAELHRGGSVVDVRIRSLYWMRDADGMLEEIQRARAAGAQTFFLYEAWAHELRGDKAAARAAYDSALVHMESLIREFPDVTELHSNRGLVLAGLGRRDDALQEARWLQFSVEYRVDAFEGPQVAQNRALILAKAGSAEEALDEVERLLAKPSFVSAETLRLYPGWDSIREHPRFKALLLKYRT